MINFGSQDSISEMTMKASMRHKSWTRMERGVRDYHTSPLRTFSIVWPSRLVICLRSETCRSKFALIIIIIIIIIIRAIFIQGNLVNTMSIVINKGPV